MSKNDTKTDKKSQKIVAKFVLDETDKLLLQHSLSKPGITDTEIGILVGLKRVQVNRRRNRPAFKAAWAEYSDASLGIVRRHMPDLMRVAIKTLKTTLDERLRVYGTFKLLAFEKQLEDKDGDEGESSQVIAIKKLNGEIQFMGSREKVLEELKKDEK